MIKKNRNEHYLRREIRVRKKLFGTKEVPRLSVFRSLKQISAQLVDDRNGITLAAASSLSKELKDEIEKTKGGIAKGKIVGQLLAKRASEKGITRAIFDRGHYKYHGRVKAIAEGAREGGLKI